MKKGRFCGVLKDQFRSVSIVDCWEPFVGVSLGMKELQLGKISLWSDVGVLVWTKLLQPVEAEEVGLTWHVRSPN